MKQFKSIAVFLLIAGLIIGSGCAHIPDNQSKKDGHQVTDSQGYKLTLPLRPQRIVSLSIATDEILMELVSPDRIAALTYLADDSGISNIVDKAKQVQTKIRVNAEAVIALQPDLVLVPSWHSPELAEALRAAGLSVYVFKSAENIAAVKQNITEIAGLVGEPEKGAAIIADMDKTLQQVQTKVTAIPDEKRQVAVRFTNMGGSGGIGSTFDDICQHAGVKNAAAMIGLDKNGTLTKEQVLHANPDFFLLPAWDYTGKQDLDKYKEEVQNDPALQSIKAVQNKKLFKVPDRYLFCTSQYIVQGVIGVAKVAYPELFSQG